VVTESHSVPAGSRPAGPRQRRETWRGCVGRAGVAAVTGRMSGTDLDRLLGHVSALLQTRWLLPAELGIKLDTFHADLLAEQEDRAARSRG
jgi:hypothetical protein